jgi:hypothetical protein
LQADTAPALPFRLAHLAFCDIDSCTAIHTLGQERYRSVQGYVKRYKRIWNRLHFNSELTPGRVTRPK